MIVKEVALYWGNMSDKIITTTIILWFAVLDNCIDAPCANDGTCTSEVKGYSCSCAPGYSGNDCNVGKFVAITYITFQ